MKAFRPFAIRSVSALALALGFLAPAAHAVEFTIEAQLVGDPRPDNPDNLIVDVTILGDTETNQAQFTVDINSLAHPDVKLDEFYFTLTGLASDYTFSGFSPDGWAIRSPGSPEGSGAGTATFMFEALDPAGPPNAPDVTNSVDLIFTVTNLAGFFTPQNFLNAAPTTTAAGTGQLGAHLQSLTANCGGVSNCSDSGFVIGGYTPGNGEVPEPGTIALLGIGMLGAIGLRRRKSSV